MDTHRANNMPASVEERAPPASESEGQGTRWFSRRLPIGILQIALIGILVSGALLYAKAPSKEAAFSQPGLVTASNRNKLAPLVSISRPLLSSNTVMVSGTGTISVRNSVTLVPQVTGRIIWVAESFRRGGSFKAYQQLIQIDRSDFELAVAKARADTQSALSNLDLTKATRDAAVSNYAILHPGKQVPLLVARAPQLEQARAQVAAAVAREDIAKLDLSRTLFSLPFDGRVVTSRAEVGQLLNKGQSFGEVFAADSVEAVVPVSPSQLELIRPALGRGATLFVGARRYRATVTRVSPELDERTRFAQLYFTIEDNSELYPGSFIDVEIEGPSLKNTLRTPEAAEQINESVWSVSDGKLKKVSPRFLNRTHLGIISQAFEVDQGVVLGTVPGAFEGMSVNV